MPDDQAVSARQDARTEVADALHDGVVQSMTAVMMRIALAAHDAPAEVAGALADVEREMSGVMRELRDLVASLRPSAADQA